MPMNVTLSEIQAGGMHEPKAEWTQKAIENLHSATEKYADQHGLRLEQIDPAKLDKRDPDFVKMRQMHTVVANTIHRHSRLMTIPTKVEKPYWTLGSYPQKLKELTKADYGLYLHFSDSFASKGRMLVMFAAAAAGVSVHGGQQMAAASMIDLNTGQVVWHDRLHKAHGDLRDPFYAGQSVQELMDSINFAP
uniref:Uncharacterized protein n=1 Tax=Magnetococcus massalia (strain MO-1) TaxID=451514 RepID=A0A1S7LNI7_MAGMO|nr:Protein of unknown function [Candidatus Magnetococcus massalia]